MEAALSQADPPPGARLEKPKHVAVVYFHGMGSQRHYEDLCRLVDRLDRTAYELSHIKGSEYDGLRFHERSARVERVHDQADAGRGRDVVYVLVRARDAHQARPAVTLRFYEAYWAPETVKGTSAGAVALWLVRQVRKPLQLLFRPWRAFPRLRRGVLVGLYQKRRDASPQNAGALRDRTARLIGLYETFQEPGARGRYPRGSFADLERHVAHELKDIPEAPRAIAALLELARDWRRDHDRREWAHLFGIVTVLAGALGLIGMLVLLAVQILALGRGSLPAWIQLPAALEFNTTPTTIATVVALLLSGLGITRFLESFVGDVQQYVTYEETDTLYQRRRAVLESATNQLRHVVENEDCERVIVVAHSLGTMVAVDAMLGLWRYNRATGTDDPMKGPIPLPKIEHLVTYGSPVDKINYFFAVIQSASGTYERLVENLRGDIGSPPFSTVGKQPRVHWINYWDKGDVVSGPIETVSGPHLRGEVDNVRVASHALPDLMGSHAAYLQHPTVIKDILDIVLSGRYGYRNAPRDEHGRPMLEQMRRGPGKGSVRQSTWFSLVLLLPWLLLLAALEVLFHWGSALRWALIVVVAVHAVALAVHKFTRARALQPAPGSADA